MGIASCESSAHPQGEVASAGGLPPGALTPPIIVDTHGRRIHVEWDREASVTPFGQLVFFAQFLATAGLFSSWVRSCPLQFTSPNAPRVTDLLGTVVLATLSGQSRYAHVTALRADTVNPQAFGMSKVCSEDSVRRAFKGADKEAVAKWLRDALRQSWLPALKLPWVLDIDTTIKPIYGKQEGAELGYNPHKPGRPSHAYHTLMIRNLRLVLDVEVRSGKEHAARHGAENLWRLLDGLTPAQRPVLVCGDANYGNQTLMEGCEARGQKYLFRLRQSHRVKELVRLLIAQAGWVVTVNGWEGMEGKLKLQGWTQSRRVVIYRRRLARSPRCVRAELEQREFGPQVVPEAEEWEYHAMVTNSAEDIVAVQDLYRQRADVENAYDELKNQWGWGGFTTRDLLRCQVSARNVALVYNWWSLFVACAEPDRGREAITSRPLLLSAVGRLMESGRQLMIRLTSTHGNAPQAQALLTGLSVYLSGLRNTAEQLSAQECWERIWARILAPWQPPKAQLGRWSG